jgi:hypothetical protein
MAKKSRTPAPPRRVQAPQRRVESRRRRTQEERRTLWMSMAFAASGVAAIAIVAALFFAFGRGGGHSAPAAVNEKELIGLQTGPAPWNPGLDHLPDRMKPLGMNELGAEGQGVIEHIHMHLDIFVNGKREPVPAGIGIFNTTGGFITDLHTHDASGVIHLESPTRREFTLGQFFGVWGVRLTRRCVGGYCKPKTPWHVFVNGEPLSSTDPSKLVLVRHQEISFVIGKPPHTIPTTYAFGGL